MLELQAPILQMQFPMKTSVVCLDVNPHSAAENKEVLLGLSTGEIVLWNLSEFVFYRYNKQVR